MLISIMFVFVVGGRSVLSGSLVSTAMEEAASGYRRYLPTDVLNKESQTADNGWSSSLGIS
jgi:hypothetical protein